MIPNRWRDIFVTAVLCFSTRAAAQLDEPTTPENTIEHLNGAVWVSQGAFTHAALSIGDDGVLLVDGVFSDSVEENDPILRRLTDEPLRFVINTHCHSDHTSANAAYEGSAVILAHPNVRKRLSTGTVVCPKAALPDIAVHGALSVHFNGEEVRLITLPAGHTDSDLMVFFTRSNVVHIGDLYVPPLGGADPSNGGRFRGLVDALAFAIETLPADVTVIPAHGPKISMVELVRSHELLREVAAFVERGVRRGESLAELKASDELVDLRAAPELAQLDWLLEGFFAELTR